MAAVKALQQWCKIQCDGYRDVSITNMTTSFRDGLAFCALIHKHRPDLIDFDSLSKENIYENNQRAFQVAEQELGIPALLDAEDMVAMKVPDRLSILTYVSQYYNYFHGRSPIGGMAGVKRPAEESIEESPGKKNQPVTAKVFGSPKPAIENKTLTPANEYKTPKPATGNITAKLPTENKAPKPANENKREVLAERVNKSSMSSSCSVCNQHVHLVQRHIVDGKLYHRNCFKCKECSSILLSGTYKTGKEPGTFVCKSHSSTQKPLTTQSTQITETPQKTQSSFFSKSTNATPTEQKETVVGSGKGALTTNTTKLSWLSNKSDRTPTRVFTPATPTPILQFTPASTPKAAASTASTTKTESTPKTSTIKTELTPKTESTPKALTTKTESTPKALTTKMESTPKALTTKTESTPKALTTKTESTPKALTTKTESTQKMSTAKTELTPKVGSTPETSTMKTPSNPRTLFESPKPASHSVQKNQEARKRFFEPSSSPSSAAPASKSFSPDTSTASVSPGQVKTPTSQNTTTPSTAGASKGRVLLRVGDWAKVTDKEKEKENEKEKAKAVIGKLVTDEKNNSSSSQSPGLKANGSNVSPVESSGKGPSGRVRLKPLDATVESTAGTASWLNAKDKTSSRPASTLSTNSKENVAASDWRSMLKPVSKPANSTESTGSPTKKLEAASSPQSSDQGISQTSISTPSKTSITTGVKDPKTPSARPQNNGSTPSDSISMSPGTETHKLHKPDYIPKDEIMKELKDIETNLNELEMRGIELEKQLRQCDDEGEEDTLMNDLMVDWFNLIRNKQVYMRRESELVYIARTQDLEEEQPSVEAELRRLMEKPEHLKTFHDRRREKELMDKLVGIVNDRNAIVEGLDEDRLREEEEDEQLKRMMQNLDVKKNKVKGKSSISRWFSMRSKRTSVED